MRARKYMSGVAYLALLLGLAVIGIVASSTVTLGVLVQRRAAEQALLDIGLEFQHALASYISATPPGRAPYPRTIADLLKDPRSTQLRRHLRKLYADPLTGQTDWGLIAAPDGQGFVGVYSRSQAKPIKRANFDSELVGFDNSARYADWHFVYSAPANAIINFSN
ncbi:MAG: type II secretion system protein [Pseudomonadota bacterium]|nr:type II secretion system protein [Pseudomonadota bacterium]